MQVNKSIYPTYSEDTYYDLTINLAEMPINKQIDDSIVYSASTSNFAPWTNYGVCQGWGYNNSYLQPGETQDRGGLIAKTGGGIQRQILIGATNNLNQVYATQSSLYNNRQAYEVSSTKSEWSAVRPVSAFKYYSAVACIYIVSIQYDYPLTFWAHDLDTYFNSHSNEKMVGAYFRIFSGNETSRSSELWFAPYDEIIIKQFGKDPADPNKFVETKSENIINHIPFNIENAGGFLTGVKSNYSAIDKYSIINSYNLGMFFNIDRYNLNDTTVYGQGYSRNMRLPTNTTLSKNDLLAMMATYGILFTTSATLARGGSNGLDLTNENKTDREKGLFSDDLYFPIKEENGLWQGRYTHGLDNENTEQYKNKWNDDKNAPFNNGSPHIDDKEEEKYGDDNLTSHGGSTSALTHRYVVDNSTMQSISTYINNVDDNLFTAIVNNMKMSGESPINSIVSVMYSPIDIATYAPIPENIIIGTNYINVGTAEEPLALTGNKLATDSVIFNLGECTINPKNKNYLDYEPYTKYICYIPFCNFVEMESSIIMGKKIGFQLICDLVAGSCEGIIRIGGLNGRIYKSVGGTFATQCSVQGLDSANYVNGVVSSLGKYVGGIGTMIGATVGVATGGVSTAIAGAGLLAGLGSTASAIYDFNTTSKNYTSTGKSIGLIGQRMPLHVCIYKFECEDNSDTNYGDFVGYACEFSETLNNLHGFTVCANAKVNANATNTEKEKIKMLLETGVYI